MNHGRPPSGSRVPVDGAATTRRSDSRACPVTAARPCQSLAGFPTASRCRLDRTPVAAPPSTRTPDDGRLRPHPIVPANAERPGWAMPMASPRTFQKAGERATQRFSGLHARTSLYCRVSCRPPKYRPVTTFWSTKRRLGGRVTVRTARAAPVDAPRDGPHGPGRAWSTRRVTVRRARVVTGSGSR